ncbi:hypothetical protein AA904_04575 [Geobacillus stearothermophilus]|nr:CPBP family intramembrane glutamic endopeptidase [Geobacillus stearothermophilus]KMY60676.1 hypothetical protein AA905_09635 [Geobacillus stearothermophilus]KMY62896.1 hypothetical protein AA904_04575 [Geobacillus stearothermophilus]
MIFVDLSSFLSSLNAFLSRIQVLFMVVVLLSLFLGVLYEHTDSLWAAITAHFLIDFVLALHVRFKRGAEEERE